MDSKQVDWKASREQERQTLRAKAPIAAQFEDCVQLFGRLCSALEAAGPAPEFVLVTAADCFGKLQIWGHDVGADSRVLDHALRGSLQLHQTTLNHLEDLREVLQHGAEEIPQQYASCTADQESSFVGTNPSQEAEPEDGQDSESDPEKYLEDAAEIIGCLFDLLPNLNDPISDLGATTEEEEATIADIQEATEAFPKAPSFLIRRLATAHWRRRQRLEKARTCPTETIANTQTNKDAQHRATQSTVQRQRHNIKRNINRRYGKSKRAESEAGVSTIGSTYVESIFSGGAFFGGPSIGGTSVDDNQLASTAILLQTPDPPQKIEPGVSFTCPYCSFEIPLTMSDMTEDGWISHVWLDLEPYICTFDECLHGHKSFGTREEWFYHERCEHRTPVTWCCQSMSCRKEFPSETSFQTHLQTVHEEAFQSRDIPLVLDAFKKPSSNAITTLTCPLCLTACQDIQKLKDHLGVHLEQYALMAIYHDQACDEQDINSEVEDEDTEATQQPSDLLLNLYFNEQTALLHHDAKPQVQTLQQQKEAWARLKDRDSHCDNPEQTNTTDSSVMLDNGETLLPRKGKNDWKNRVNVFLDKQDSREVMSGDEDSPQLIQCNLPPRNHEFVGRKEGLGRIHDVLSKPGQVLVLSGCGGIGKTATAVEYSHLFQKDYSAIFWIEAETAGGCADKYSLIASCAGLPGKGKQSLEGLTSLVKEYLSKTEKRWLLIFDNVEDWGDISRYIPRNMSATAGSVFITTRNSQNWPKTSRHYHHLALDVLTLEESTSLLLRSLKLGHSGQGSSNREEYESAAEASRLVGQLPLAISMVAGYILVSRCSLGEFLETWEERESLSKEINKSIRQSTGAIDASIDALWDIGIGELSMKARNLLDILSFLDPDSIQKDLLVGDHKEQSLKFLNEAETIRYNRMIDQLSGRKLINIKEFADGTQTYSIHRLLQQKIMEDMGGYQFHDAFQKAVYLVKKKYPPASVIQVPEPSKWADCEKYILHVYSLHRVYQQFQHNRIKPTFDLAELFYDAGFHVWERQTTAYDGLSFLKSAEKLLDDIHFDEFGKLRADIHIMAGLFSNGLGSAYRDESVRREKEALKIRERNYNGKADGNPSDVLYRNAAGDLAYCLMNKYEFEEASRLFEGCLAQYRLWGTEDKIPFEYSKYYMNNGLVLMFRGKYTEAVESLEKSVQLAEKHSTRTWHYWQYKFALGCVLLQLGDTQRALDVHLEVLNGRLDLSGKHDQNTIFSTYAVGAIYHHLGALPTATDYMLEFIECAKNSRIPEESLGRAEFHLSKLYREQKIEETEAKVLETDALRILDKYSRHISKFLTGVDDYMVMFDDLQSVSDGRFTGKDLLRRVQASYSMSPESGLLAS